MAASLYLLRLFSASVLTSVALTAYGMFLGGEGVFGDVVYSNGLQRMCP